MTHRDAYHAALGHLKALLDYGAPTVPNPHYGGDLCFYCRADVAGDGKIRHRDGCVLVAAAGFLGRHDEREAEIAAGVEAVREAFGESGL